ncbi:MAG: dihydrofolate reductase family protein [Chloroflexi bacterium]|nr:dihydrofolate reductase family protein [Chloroflexota bacterium]MDA1219007.1 dihydrofolate reductase family protein [Chloroflexota bacterium]PKB57083.1 MAG: deaminase [SAR202 cluster bacterium Casp-Chloro-G3]
MKITLYIAASLDGFIAGPDGELDWLSMADSPGEDFGYNDFYNSVDALVMGRKTYEIPAGEAEWPYPGKPSYVLTRQDLKTDRDDVIFVSDPVQNVVESLRSQGFQHVWLVGGGELIRSFLAQGLINEHIISFMPIILGAGIPLFPPPNPQQRLELISSQQFESGLIQAQYRSIATA